MATLDLRASKIFSNQVPSKKISNRLRRLFPSKLPVILMMRREETLKIHSEVPIQLSGLIRKINPRIMTR